MMPYLPSFFGGMLLGASVIFTGRVLLARCIHIWRRKRTIILHGLEGS